MKKILAAVVLTATATCANAAYNPIKCFNFQEADVSTDKAEKAFYDKIKRDIVLADPRITKKELAKLRYDDYISAGTALYCTLEFRNWKIREFLFGY